MKEIDKIWNEEELVPNWICNKLTSLKISYFFILWFHLGQSKPIRRPDPLEETDRIQSDTSQPNYSSGWWRVFTSRNRLQRVGFSFPPPK